MSVQQRFQLWTSHQESGRWFRGCRGEGGGECCSQCVLSRPPPLQGGSCLLTAEWHHQGGPLCPLFWLGALKFCTQRLHGAPICRSEWTQHFWKSLTRLNHSAISCQSAHTSCFSELRTGSKPCCLNLTCKATSYTTIVCQMEECSSEASISEKKRWDF